MVAATDKNPSKTDFATQLLQRNAKANVRLVNEAWKAAGHDGEISVSLVQKIRSDLGLTGNLRGRSKKAKRDGVGEGLRRKLKDRGPKRANGRSRTQGNGMHSASLPARKPLLNDPEWVLDDVEGELDRLIFKLMGIGGMEEVEDALRRVRRLVVVRSHMA
jgi:hypothetical protein